VRVVAPVVTLKPGMSGMAHVLVTGAGGFLGPWTVRALHDRGHTVTGCGRSEAPPDVLRSDCLHTWRQADLTCPASCTDLCRSSRADTLIHLAWITTPGEYWESPENERWLSAGRTLVRSFLEHGGRRLVIAGTCAEYDWGHLSQTDGVADESSTPILPGSLYARSKHALHLDAVEACRRGGASLAWGRLFFLLGPREDPRRFVPQLILAALSRGSPHCRAPHLIRDYMDARDAGRALAELALSPVEGPVNIGTGRGTPLGDIARLVGECCGCVDRLRLGAESPPGQPAALVANTARLQREVGFRPRYPLAQAVADAVEFWRARTDRRREQTVPRRSDDPSDPTARP
jgi:nucleoside-diphosphate-sugar epimerase